MDFGRPEMRDASARSDGWPGVARPGPTEFDSKDVSTLYGAPGSNFSPVPYPVAPSRQPSGFGTEEIKLLEELEAMRSVPDDEHQETVSGIRRPPPADPDADTGDLPSPAFYEKMVVEYRGQTDTEGRRKIQRRLEQDSLSDNAVVRYYAVEAMAKLGTSIFGNALLAATEDDDEAVRNLAVQSLRS